MHIRKVFNIINIALGAVIIIVLIFAVGVGRRDGSFPFGGRNAGGGDMTQNAASGVTNSAAFDSDVTGDEAGGAPSGADTGAAPSNATASGTATPAITAVATPAPTTGATSKNASGWQPFTTGADEKSSNAGNQSDSATSDSKYAAAAEDGTAGTGDNAQAAGAQGVGGGSGMSGEAAGANGAGTENADAGGSAQQNTTAATAASVSEADVSSEADVGGEADIGGDADVGGEAGANSEAGAAAATAGGDGSSADIGAARGGDISVVSLAGKVVCIDAGHQKKQNSDLEPVAPDSSIKKPKVSSGTAGISTGIPEYELNLAVALKLKAKLEAAGATVVMTRTENDVDISNVERAKIGNEAKADLAVRIHADGSTNRDAKGALMLIPSSKYIDAELASVSKTAGQIVLDEIIASTGAKSRGLSVRDDMTGFNWSTVPVILIEMGYMTNPDEDRLMATDEYRAKLAAGLYNGCAKFLSD